jgi:hypothetical protein
MPAHPDRALDRPVIKKTERFKSRFKHKLRKSQVKEVRKSWRRGNGAR